MLNENNNKCYIIAEAGLNHNGSLDLAFELINIASQSRVDAVKFQKRTISELAIEEELNKEDMRFPSFGKTYGEIRNYLEFDLEEYKSLKDYSEKLGLDFIVTPFDIKAVNFLEKIDLKIYKLASHSLTNLDLLHKVAALNKKTILSTGMSEIEDIDKAVDIFKQYENDNLSLLHCISSYPTPIEDCNLSMINFFKKRYNLKVGYSGHEIGYLPSLTAAALGADIIERHHTLSKDLEGFDHKLSLEPNELKEMTEKIREIDKIIGFPKKNISETEMITKKKYNVSMVSNQLIKKGELISKSHISYKNPGTGILPKYENQILGKKTLVDIEKDTIITYNMFENNE